MKLEKKYLNLEKGLEKEWILTNGIGGYSSSTIIGANTRKYHGLLVASLNSPGKRYLVLSKIDESIEIDGQKYLLYTNIGKNFITNGCKYQDLFEKQEYVKFTYQVNGIKIEKTICMEHGKNTVVILYNIINKGKSIKLTLTPIINFRDFHSINNNHKYKIEQENQDEFIKIILDDYDKDPIYINCSCGKYIKHENDCFNNMYYKKEEQRGFECIENHAVPGRYEITINPNEQKEISFVCSLDENIKKYDSKKVIRKEIKRIKEQIDESGLLEKYPEDIVKKYIIATDNFIVYRKSFNLHTIIAGYPWFLDWGRDSLISFEGLLLIPKRFKIAKEVLKTVLKDVKCGLVPNGYSENDNSPLYNSVDSSLLLFNAVEKYLYYTKDEKFVKDYIYNILEDIINNYIKGIDIDDNNIFLDNDYLIHSGTEFTQNTWMDAKIDNFAVTPRNGKAVEINALWYNSLKIMEKLSKEFGYINNARKYTKLANKCKESFNEKFYNQRKKCLYDVLEDDKIRPNQLFAIGLQFPVIDPKSDMAKNIFNTITKKLLNSYGLKTLAKGEQNYIEIYEGDRFKRDLSYHQGITWPWLLGIYNDSFKNIIKNERSIENKKQLNLQYNDFIANVKNIFLKELDYGNTIGNISEIYDSKKPYCAKGAFAQSWSVSEIFRIIL